MGDIPTMEEMNATAFAEKMVKRNERLRAQGILIIEDDTAYSELLDAKLRHNGFYNFTIVPSAEAALGLDLTRYRLALVDYHLAGGIDGIEAIPMLKQKNPDLLCVLHTGLGPDPDLMSMIESGTKIMSKPVDFRVLMSEYINSI